MSVKVRVPATSANLGPGFDCMGLALTLYNTVTVEPAKQFNIELSGKYTAGIATDEQNLVWKTMCHLWQAAGFPIPTVSLYLENNIPPARGLGSSSAAIAAGLVAANVLAGNPFTDQQILDLGNELEGHPDNITPALFGGVDLALPTKQGVMTRILASSPPLKAVVVIPDILVKTADARNVLPPEIPRRDAVFNIAHAGLIVEAFLTQDYALLREGMQDKLHQNQRAGLIPGMHDVIRAAMAAGAFGAALSGSGPTIIALCDSSGPEDVQSAMLKAIHQHAVKAEALVLKIDPVGAHII